MISMFIAAVVTALVLGFLAGLLAFRVKSRWCPTCGASTMTLAERHQQTTAQHR
jgi:hypothetical protein